jgi:hypothetical protein
VDEDQRRAEPSADEDCLGQGHIGLGRTVETYQQAREHGLRVGVRGEIVKSR